MDTMKKLLTTHLLALLLAGSFAEAAAKPNIVLIFMDDRDPDVNWFYYCFWFYQPVYWKCICKMGHYGTGICANAHGSWVYTGIDTAGVSYW